MFQDEECSLSTSFSFCHLPMVNGRRVITGDVKSLQGATWKGGSSGSPFFTTHFSPSSGCKLLLPAGALLAAKLQAADGHGRGFQRFALLFLPPKSGLVPTGSASLQEASERSLIFGKPTLQKVVFRGRKFGIPDSHLWLI